MSRLTKTQPPETIGDYPAAHSMDTTWFAIDRDGCIGSFFSDENGHVPSKVFEPLMEVVRSSPVDAWVVTPSEGKSLSAGHFLLWDDLRDFLFRQLLAGLSAEFAAQAVNRECHLDPLRLYGDEQVLLLPAHEALGLKLTQDERFLRIPDDSRCIITESFSRELFDSLHRDGLCRGCFAATEAGLGLYSYSHESAINAPYERTRRPERRCNLSQVREPYRRLFQLVHFDTLCFEDATELQPLEFEACVGWGSTAPEHNLWWVAWYDRHSHAIRPIRGKEREYAAHHEKIVRWAQDQEPWTSRSGQEVELHIEPPQEFPAAHSMDTNWFAVDRDGRVGFFRAAEDGHVPSQALCFGNFGQLENSEEAWPHLIQASLNLVATRFPPHHVLDLNLKELPVCTGSSMLRETHGPFTSMAVRPGENRRRFQETVLLCLNDRSELGNNSQQADVRVLGDDANYSLVLVSNLSVTVYRRLHTQGLCQGCLRWELPDTWLPKLLGLTCYVERSDWSRLYVRQYFSPSQPLLLEDLHPFARDWFSRIRFEAVSFQEANEVLPLAHFPVKTYQDNCFYLDQLQTIRHIPGYEAAFRERSTWLLETAVENGWDMEPPRDFPAAHSMDTTWFAVDREGQLAAFATGANGPASSSSIDGLPAIFDREEWVGMQLELHQRLASDQWDELSDLEWIDSSTFSGVTAPSAEAARMTLHKIWVFHDLTDSLLHLSRAYEGIVLRTSPPAIYFGNLNAAQVRTLLREESFRGYLKVPMLCGEDFARFGLWVYAYEYWKKVDCESPPAIADIHPYRQIKQGASSVSLATLPPPVRSLFLQHVLDVDFAAAPWIQPYDFLPHITCWYDHDSSYLTSNLRQIKCIPGRAREYRKRYADLLDRVISYRASIEVAPPPEHESDYPAAHSGDVSWFAVDVEDNVGVFFASETSAIPWVEMAERSRVRAEDLTPDVAAQLLQQEQDLANTDYDCSDELLAAHLAGEAQRIMPEITKLPVDCVRIGYEVEACLHPWNVDWYGEFDDNQGVSLVAMLDQPSLGAWVLLLRDREAIRAELESGIAWLPPQRPCGRSIVAAFANLPNTTGRRLLQAGVCLGAKRDLQPIHICMGHGRPEWTARGFYAYVVAERHGETNGMENRGCFSHQYLRDLFPATPLKSTSLPPPLRRLMERNRLPFSFETACFVQPELYFPCRRDTHELRLVDFNGAPTAELLARPSFREFCEHQRGEREQAIDEVRLQAANNEDFPAAHSGDVTWFAVDAGNNVAVFCASETSAIPWIDPSEQAQIQRDCFDAAQNARFDRLRKELGEALPGRQHQFLEWHLEAESALVTRELEQLRRSPSKIGYEVHACLHPWNDDWYGEFWDHERNRPFWFEPGEPNLGTWLVWLSDIRLVQWELERGQATLPPQSRQGDQGVVLFSDLPVALAKRLIGCGACLGLKRIWPTLTGLRGREEWAMRGIYHYLVVDRQDLAYGLTSSHQYLRDLFPSSPLHIDELSARARRIVRRIQLPVSFREASFIQPELYVPCRRDVWPQKFVEFDGTPTARLLASTGFLEFVERQAAQREESLFEAMVIAESAGDYPAAHSMDVGWFATDSEGRVAHFFTGQDGSLPASWAYMPNHLVDRDKTRKEHQFATHKRCDNLDQFLLLEIARSCPTSILRNMVATPELRQRWLDSFFGDHLNAPWLAQAGPHPETHDGNLLLRLNPAWQDDQLCPMIDGEDANGLVTAVANSFALTNEYQGEVILRTELCRLLLIREISVSLARQIHADRACLGCLNIYDEPERMGIFRYECDSQQSAYQRIASPLDPLTLGSLPMEVQEYLKCVQFNGLEFSRQPSIKVNEHQFCLEYGENSWRLDYQSGRVRLNARDKSDSTYPACLAQYRASYPKLLEWALQHGYTVEPPPE